MEPRGNGPITHEFRDPEDLKGFAVGGKVHKAEGNEATGFELVEVSIVPLSWLPENLRKIRRIHTEEPSGRLSRSPSEDSPAPSTDGFCGA